MVTFKINGIDISNDVMLNTFNYMQRIDDVFGTGSFQFESKEITENIAPYSILQIDDYYYCCSSEATYHYGRQSWFHNVSVIEATSLLSRFLVGSKAFSITGTNTYDYDKIPILTKLINQKYGVNITIQGNQFDFNKKIEYVFGAGTTLFDALSEIAKQYNIRFYVASVNGNDIVLKYQKLDNLDGIAWDNDLVISKTKIQNAENYCKYLETEATNVIDTNQTTIVSNIFPTAKDIKLSEDTYLIQMPTPIYDVKKVNANILGKLTTEIWVYTDIDNGTYTYEEFCAKVPEFKGLFDKTYSKYFSWDYFKKTKWHKEGVAMSPSYDNIAEVGGARYLNLTIKIDITSHILSKEQYDLVEDKDKPNYAYYTLGSKDIDGFNIYYKNGFWETIIGQRVIPFMENISYTDKEYQTEWIYEDLLYMNLYSVEATHSLLKTTFDVEYYPIANPYMVETKKDTPLNETNYKPYALSYIKSSNYVDFDKMTKSMQLSNKSLGKVEMVVEYDTTSAPFGFPLMRKVELDGKEWYISSSETTYKNGQQISKFNLVSEFNKIADAIALNSQYNTLKNPLENIIERPIFYEIDKKVTITKGQTYARFRFYDNIGNYQTIVMPTIILNQDNETYIYVEMQDQYCASKNVVAVSGNVFKVNEVPYGNANNEIERFYMWLVDLTDLTLDEIKKLPEEPSKWTNQVSLVDSKLLYKDAREKLTFTIKLNNCIIK